MAWAEFTADHDFRPGNGHQGSVAYKAGMRCAVTAECLAHALRAGVALEVETPNARQAKALIADPYWRPDGPDVA